MVEITANSTTVKIEGTCTAAQILETYSRVTHSIYSALQGSGFPEDVAKGLVVSAATLGTDGETIEPKFSIKAVVPAKDNG